MVAESGGRSIFNAAFRTAHCLPPETRFAQPLCHPDRSGIACRLRRARDRLRSPIHLWSSGRSSANGGFRVPISVSFFASPRPKIEVKLTHRSLTEGIQ